MNSFFDILKRMVSVKTTSVLLLVAVMLCMTPLSSSAAPVSRWYVKMQVSYLSDHNTVILGAATDATDAFENAYSARSIKSRYLSAYIYRPEWNMDTDFFTEDIKGVDLPKTWTFYVESRFTKDLTLSWGELVNVPTSITLTLVDSITGTSTVMTAGGTYVYDNSSTLPREFNVVASGAFDTTAPDTQILNLPSGYIGTEPLTVEFTGTDNVTPLSALEYSYSIDEGVNWSAYSTEANVTLEGLLEGEYVFSVKARDETGNEDATPSEAIFIVGDAPTRVIDDSATTGRIVAPTSSGGRRVTPSSEPGGRFVAPRR